MKGNEDALDPPAESRGAVDSSLAHSPSAALSARALGRGAALVILALLWARTYAGVLRVRLLDSEYFLLALCVVFFLVLSGQGYGALRRPLTRALRSGPLWILALLLALISYLALWRISQITAAWGLGLGVLCTIHVFLRKVRTGSPLNETASGFLSGFWFAAGAFLPGFAADGYYDGYVRVALCAGVGIGMAFLRLRERPQAFQGAPMWLAHPAVWLSAGLMAATWLTATEISDSTRVLYLLVLGTLILLLFLELLRARGFRPPELWIWLALGLPALVSVPWLGP